MSEQKFDKSFLKREIMIPKNDFFGRLQQFEVFSQKFLKLKLNNFSINSFYDKWMSGWGIEFEKSVCLSSSQILKKSNNWKIIIL